MAAIKGKPHDHDLARRIVHAAGISDRDLSARAKQTLNRLVLADRERVAQNPDQAPTDPRELWQANSAQQLRRWFGGRCITCAKWTPPEAEGSGTCPIVSAVPGSDVAILTAGFGCTAWAEIPADDAATIASRTELAMVIGLLEPYPS